MGRAAAFFIGVFLLVLGGIGLVGPWYQNYEFSTNCADYLKRAADAPSLQLADEAMVTAITYLDDHGINGESGYSTLILRKTEHDVGYWYKQITAARQDVADTLQNGDVDKLTESNALMKLREVLLDSGAEGDTLTLPANMAYYPNQWFWRIISSIGWVLAIIGILVAWISLAVGHD